MDPTVSDWRQTTDNAEHTAPIGERQPKSSRQDRDILVKGKSLKRLHQSIHGPDSQGFDHRTVRKANSSEAPDIEVLREVLEHLRLLDQTDRAIFEILTIRKGNQPEYFSFPPEIVSREHCSNFTLASQRGFLSQYERLLPSLLIKSGENPSKNTASNHALFHCEMKRSDALINHGPQNSGHLIPNMQVGSLVGNLQRLITFS